MFKINWDIILVWLIPPRLRRSVLVAFLQVCYSQIKLTNDEFLELREKVLDEMRWQGSSAELVWMLQKRFGTKYVREKTLETVDEIYLFGDNEDAEPTYLFGDSDYENDETLKKLYLFGDGSMEGVYNSTIDFPLGLKARDSEIRAMIERYRPAGLIVEITY